ncbi:MAG: hypothetical protein AAB308_02440 [Nitrospirota bacterium]|jgi:hypothetical protein
MAKGEHKKIARPQQSGYDITLDPEGHEVTQVWIRFGTLEGNDIYKWDLTVGPIEFKSDHKKAVMKVDDDQLPASVDTCYYQMLCEIDNEHGEPETFMTEPTLLVQTYATL